MNKNLVNSVVLVALALGAVSSTTVSALPVVVERAKKFLIDNGVNPSKQAVAKAKRMWFCYTNQSKCPAGEVVQARRWIIGVPAAIISALLILGGVLVAKHEIDKEKAAQEAEKRNKEKSAQKVEIPKEPEEVITARKEWLNAFSNFNYLAQNANITKDFKKIDEARDVTQQMFEKYREALIFNHYSIEVESRALELHKYLISYYDDYLSAIKKQAEKEQAGD